MSHACPDRLNVAHWEPRSVVNGPGERFVLWLQGCPLRCPGCLNPELQPFVPRHRLTIAQVEALVASARGVEGVTFTGGEPLAQAAALAPLAQRLRRRGLTVMAYTGFTLAELHARHDPDLAALLEALDLLIDGPYREAERAPLRWRGSANQKIHCLSPAYRDLVAAPARPGAEVELIVGREGWVTTGFFAPEWVGALGQSLAEVG